MHGRPRGKVSFSILGHSHVLRKTSMLRSDCTRALTASEDCGPSRADSTSGGTNGFIAGTRSSARLCAKKHTRRRQPVPSLHSCVLYLVFAARESVTTVGLGETPRCRLR